MLAPLVAFLRMSYKNSTTSAAEGPRSKVFGCRPTDMGPSGLELLTGHRRIKHRISPPPTALGVSPKGKYAVVSGAIPRPLAGRIYTTSRSSL